MTRQSVALLLDPPLPGDAVGEKPGTLDILVREAFGTLTNAEMQPLPHPAFRQRVRYWTMGVKNGP